MTLARPAPETCLQRLRIQLWSPAVAGHPAICGDQCVPTQIIIRRSCFATTIRLLLALFFSPVWWPLVILLLPGVTPRGGLLRSLRRAFQQLQKPLIGSQASWWKHIFVPGKTRVRAWALAVCVRASDNLGGPFFRHAVIALPDSAYCCLQDRCVLKEARVCHVVPGGSSPEPEIVSSLCLCGACEELIRECCQCLGCYDTGDATLWCSAAS